MPGVGQLVLSPPDGYDPRMFELYRRGFQRNVDMFTGRRMRKLGEFEEAKGSVFQIGIGNLSRGLLAATVFGSNADYPDGDYATLRSKLLDREQRLDFPSQAG